VQSALGWWREAGVDVMIDEEPRDWLRPAKPATVIAEAPAAALPATLAALNSHLADTAFASLGARRLAPAGDPASGLMVIADMPEQGDVEAGQIFAGEHGRLFDRMLAAIGRDRASIYLATISPARAAGRLDAAAAEALKTLALHHIALAQPRMLLVIGQGACTMLLGLDLPAARGRIHQLNHDGGMTPAIATIAPRYLLKQPATKADAWKDLRLMLEELNR
jgi:DNA polymerase